MKYTETKPGAGLEDLIHSYWELKEGEQDGRWERNFPDGCAGLVINLGDTCLTDNGEVAMEYGKTYAVGAMTTFKDSYIHSPTHLMGICLKPAAFANFYSYALPHQWTNHTVELEKSLSFDFGKIRDNGLDYLNRFFIDRRTRKYSPLQPFIKEIHTADGQVHIVELAKMNAVSVRQLERVFKKYLGLSPNEYSNIVRFQKALRLIKNAKGSRSLMDIAFECGYYDHSHLSNDIKRKAGCAPSFL